MAEHIQPVVACIQPACGTEKARNQHLYGTTTAPSISIDDAKRHRGTEAAPWRDISNPSWHVYSPPVAPRKHAASILKTQSAIVAPQQLLGSALKAPKWCLDDTAPGRKRFALHLSPHSRHHSLCAKRKHKECGRCGRFREKLDAVAFWGQASWMFASKETK